MFTGIVEEIGTVLSVRRGTKSLSLNIAGEKVFSNIRLGESVAVNGVCLTVSQLNGKTFDVMAESLQRSNLGTLKSGSLVNLERAMPAQGRFGGHLVYGHIDGMGKIVGIEREDNAVLLTVEAEQNIMRYIVEKGSIAIDGISLTVSQVCNGRFQVSVIPHTAAHTTLLSKKSGEMVNLENDIIAKYIEKFMVPNQGIPPKPNGISLEFLASHGFE